jgi:sugar lactone lactonase YvrE
VTLRRILLGAAFVARPLSAQTDPVVESRVHYQAAARAYEARDLPTFLEHARKAQELRPAHGGVTLALASALALNGDTAGAFRALSHFAALGYSTDLEADSDFESLRASGSYPDLARRLERNREPVVVSRPAFELPDSALLTEGIAYDDRERVFYVGSVRQGKILRVTPGGEAADFARIEEGRWAPLGLQVDPRRRVLWVAAAALPQSVGHLPADSGRSAILRYDLRTGRLTGRHLTGTGQPHAIGDLVITRGGDVYATDSRASVIFRVRAGGDSLEPFITSPLLLSAQGLALTPDERTLYVADYARGILRVDLRRRVVSQVEAVEDVLALGIDGLYLHGGGLIGIQNGVTPHRVVRLKLAPEGNRVLRAEVLERAHPMYAEPTLGVLVGSALFYVANSQWERFGSDGTVAHPDSLRRPVVLRLPL